METMRKALFDIFRSFDKEDLGIVSFTEFEEVEKRKIYFKKFIDFKKFEFASFC